MLRIVNNEGRKPRRHIKRRVMHRTDSPPVANFQEIIKEKERKEEERQQDLENRFRQKLRNTAEINWLQKTCFEVQPSPQIDPREMRKWQVMGLVRGTLEGTQRHITKAILYANIKKDTDLTYGFGEQAPLSYEEFSSVIDEMVKRGFLESFTNWDGKPAFRWAGNAPDYPGNEPL